MSIVFLLLLTVVFVVPVMSLGSQHHANPPRRLQPADPRPRLLMVADDSSERLLQIKRALESTGLFATVHWTRDLHLIPKYYESYIRNPKSVLAANCDKFDIVLVDHRASDHYEWGWSPADVFSKFSPAPERYAEATGHYNGNALKVGMGPTERHSFLTAQGSHLNLTYEELLANRRASSATFPQLLVDVNATARRMVAMLGEIMRDKGNVSANDSLLKVAV